MERDHENKSIYQSLPMQAALRLYVPHSDSSEETYIPETLSVDVPMEPLRHRLGRLKRFFTKNKGKMK